jgi:drug/metabolite transporter (DMT)-like permease
MILFSLALAIYSTASLLVKMSMETYFLTPQESLYYVSLMVLLCFYGSIITNKQDILNIAPESYFPLFMRCLCGFLSEILLYMAFAQTNYSKAICIFFTNTLMIPFFGKCILGENIIKWDIIAILCGFAGMILIV